MSLECGAPSLFLRFSDLVALRLESCQEHEDENLFQLLAKNKIL